MKKYLLALFTLLFFANPFFAQVTNPVLIQKQKEAALRNKQTPLNGIVKQSKNEVNNSTSKSVVLGSKEYDLLKASGKLAHYEVKMNNNGNFQRINSPANTTTVTTPCEAIPYSGTPVAYTVVDDQTSAIPLPFNFCFYGTNYTSCNVSINGNIQFSSNSAAFSSTGFPSTAVNMIAPFWADCYLTSGSSVKVDVYPTYLVISWDSIGYYQSHNDKTNSFQCVLTNGLDPILPPGKNVGFYYKKMQWTTGDASSGVNGFPNPNITPSVPATIGINQGNGIDYYLIGRFGQPGFSYDGPLGNDDGISWLNNKRFYFNVCAPVGSNIEPTGTLIGYCDTLKVCGNDTLVVKNTFIAPEISQSVTVTATSAPSGTNTALGSSFSFSTVTNSNGTDIFMMINANTAPANSSGYHIITMTATDNGTPAQTSVQTFVVYFDQTGINNLTGNVILSSACPGGLVTASVNVTGGPIDDYLWNNNSNTSSTTYTAIVGADSLVFVTVKSGQCKKTFSNTIHINPNPVVSISGNLNLCTNSTFSTVLTASNTLNSSTQAPYSYTWTGSGSISSTNTSSTSVTAGNYVATISNQYGCAASATTNVVLNEGPIYNITTNATSNGSVYCATQDTARLAFHYPTSSEPFCAVSTTSNNCIYTTVAQTGTATTSGFATAYTPYSGAWEGGHHQYLYKASELLASGLRPGKITDLAFNVTNLNGGNLTYSDFKVSIKCTTDNSLTLTAMDYTNLVQVYGPLTATVTTGWNTYNFSQPYLWDGTSNILVDVCYYEPNYNANNAVEYTNVGYNATRYDYWFTDICGDLYVTNVTQNRPNIKFSNCVVQQSSSQFNVSVTPTLGVVVNAAKDSIKIVIPPAGSSVCYTVSVFNPIGGCPKDTVICLQSDQGVTNANFSANTATVCQGGSVILNASGADTYTISYIQNGNPIQLTTNSTFTHIPLQVGLNVYSLTAVGFCGAAPVGYTVGVTVIPVATLTMTALQDVTKCLNNPFILSANAGSATSGNTGMPYNYAWTTLPGNNPAPGTNSSSSYTTNSNSTSTLVVTVNGVCASSTKDTVIVKNYSDNLSITVADSLIICGNTEFTSNVQITGGYPNFTYAWYITGNTNAISNNSNITYISPETEGIYVLSVDVIDSCGYTDTDIEVIKVLPPCNIIIPNVITANGDGKNDVFKIQNIEFHPNTLVTIFDRWGRKVYENKNYQNDWKADNVGDGTFFYVVDVPNDKKYNGFITVFHGK